MIFNSKIILGVEEHNIVPASVQLAFSMGVRWAAAKL